ncbi:MAG: tetratricopeptide repeat protein [Bacteroidales bacterium]|nr:tetratricopeptide repeat protein [Bacteroidales bacterium]
MERERRIMKYSVQRVLMPAVLLILAFSSLKANAGAYGTYDSTIKQAFMKGQMEKWDTTISKMEQEYFQTNDAELLFHLTTAAYGLTGYLLGNDKEKAGEEMLEKTTAYCQKLKETRYSTQAYAIEAGTYGYRISLKPFKAMAYGRKNQRAIEKAMALDDENPMVWMEKGNAYYHMPGIFGGSYKKAISCFIKAIELYKKAPGKYPEWLLLNAMVWLGKAYDGNGEEDDARAIYRQALQLEPQFHWVKNDLLPGLSQ